MNNHSQPETDTTSLKDIIDRNDGDAALQSYIGAHPQWHTETIDGSPLIHYAAAHNNVAALEAIQQAAPEAWDAKANQLNENGDNNRTPLAEAVFQGNIEAARFLVKNGAKIKRKSVINHEQPKCNPFVYAVVCCQYKMVKMFLKDCPEGNYPDVSQTFDWAFKESSWTSMTPLSALMHFRASDLLENKKIGKDSVKIASLLWEKSKRRTSLCGQTFLHMAALQSIKMVDWLVSEGFSLQAKDNGGLRPDEMPGEKNYIADYRNNMKQYAKNKNLSKLPFHENWLDLPLNPEFDSYFIHDVVANNNVSMLDILHRTLSKEKWEAMVDLAQNAEGGNRTPLAEAIFNNNKEAVESLVKYGADLTHQSVKIENSNLLKSHFEQFQSLLSAGDAAPILKFLEEWNPNWLKVPNGVGLFPAHILAQKGHLAALQALLGKHPDIMQEMLVKPDDVGATPLHHAVQGKDRIKARETVAWLKAQKFINVNAQDSWDYTAYHRAAKQNDMEMVRLLEQNRDLDVTLKNRAKHTAEEGTVTCGVFEDKENPIKTRKKEFEKAIGKDGVETIENLLRENPHFLRLNNADTYLEMAARKDAYKVFRLIATKLLDAFKDDPEKMGKIEGFIKNRINTKSGKEDQKSYIH